MTTDTAPSRVTAETDRFIACYVRDASSVRQIKTRVWPSLLNLLECPHPVVEKSIRSILIPPQVPERSLDIQASLVKLLFTIGMETALKTDRYAILGGLHRAACWRDCLATEDGAYLLAASLVDFLDAYSTQFDMVVAVAPAVISILNDWLQPEVPWVLPSPAIVCEKLFGVAWAQLALPEDCRDLGGWMRTSDPDSRDVISRLRPPFLPSLGIAQTSMDSDCLPELGSSAWQP